MERAEVSIMVKFLNAAQVAERTGISKWTLRYWTRNGQGPAHKRTPGGHYLFRESDVRRWLSELEGPAVIEPPELSGEKVA
jgi:excisionase family DNA binding protein